MAVKLVICAVLLVCAFQAINAARIPRDAETAGTDAETEKNVENFKKGLQNIIETFSKNVDQLIQSDKVKEMLDNFGQGLSEATKGVEKLGVDTLAKLNKKTASADQPATE